MKRPAGRQPLQPTGNIRPEHRGIVRSDSASEVESLLVGGGGTGYSGTSEGASAARAGATGWAVGHRGNVQQIRASGQREFELILGLVKPCV